MQDIYLLKEFTIFHERRIRCQWCISAFLVAVFYTVDLIINPRFKELDAPIYPNVAWPLIVTTLVFILIILLILLRFYMLTKVYVFYYEVQGETSIKQIQAIAILIICIFLMRLSMSFLDVYTFCMCLKLNDPKFDKPIFDDVFYEV